LLLCVRITWYAWRAVLRDNRRNRVKQRQQLRRRQQLRQSFRLRSTCRGVDVRRTGAEPAAAVAAAVEGRQMSGDRSLHALRLALTATSVERRRHSLLCSVNRSGFKIFVFRQNNHLAVSTPFTLKVKARLDIYYRPLTKARKHQRFTISEVAADWHEPMVPQRITWLFIARANGQ